MPTITTSNIPSPKSWDEFEDITLSAAKLRWNSSDFYRHGRQGQKQEGVDIYGHDHEGRHLGVQCKNTTGRVTEAIVKAEIALAEAFSPPIDALYIATTAKRDAVIQKAVRKLSAQRKKAGKFPVHILFWDDITHDLASDEEVFFKHYSQFRSRANPAEEHDRELFESLMQLLATDGVISFLDQTNMAGFPYPEAALEPLRQFYFKWNQAEREFITPEIEALKKAIWAKVDEYYDLISTHTFPTRNPDWHTVPPEWELERPELFHYVVDQLHSLAGQIVALHGELVRTGRAHLISGKKS
jgi:hypothetical protein